MKTIAVIFGGQSVEHDVSIVTALGSVIKPLELTRNYKVVPVYIAKDGTWYSDDRLKDIALFTSDGLTAFLRKIQPVTLRFGKGLQLIKSTKFKKVIIDIDLAFPAMHGTKGEDGSLMGLLELANIPYVGCGVSASSLAMDKILSKIVAQSVDIPVTKFLHYSKTEVENSMDNIIDECLARLSLPVFVKPPHLGSSIGITKATNKNELMNAIEVAVHYDDSVLIEEGVSDLIEVTLPIIGNEVPIPSLLESPLIQSEDFFDFDTKYMQGGKKGKTGKGAGSIHGYSQLPAELPKGLYEKAEKVGLEIYKALGCTGIARVDMLINSKTGEVFFNEVNPLPGDLYAHNWAQNGVSKMQLVEKLVQYAEERFEQAQKRVSVFDTSYLKQF